MHVVCEPSHAESRNTGTLGQSRLTPAVTLSAFVRFASLRSDVLVKLELLDQKHVQDIVHQLQVSQVAARRQTDAVLRYT